MNLADVMDLIIPPREAEYIPNPDKQPMQLSALDLSRPGNMPPGSHYPNPDANENPRGPPAPRPFVGPPAPTAEDLAYSLPKNQQPKVATGGAASGGPPGPEQLSDPMQDPGFRAFVAQKARDLDELRAAQQASNEARNSFGMRAGNALIAGGMVGGIGADPTAMLRQRFERAGQPVADVLARQKAAGELTKNASADVGLSGELMKNRIEGEENNPNSPRSQAMLRAAGLRPDLFPGVSGSMVPTAQKGQQIGVEKEKNAIEKEKVELPEYAPVPELPGTLYNKHKPEIIGGNGGGRPLHPQDAMKLDAILNGIESVDRVKGARSDGVLPGFGEYDATLKGEAPALAAADSGTGRASGQNDILKRAPNLYSAAGDTTFDADRTRYVQAATQKIAALKQAGYNVAEQEARLQQMAGQKAPGAPTHYLISPDRKQRIPADASGKPIGPAEPNPNG